jgi:hypothetical protein
MRKLVPLLLLVGCNASAPAPETPDAACEVPAPPACTDEGNEDCDKCWKQIGTCCYGDVTILGRVDPLIAVCRAQPSCASCCNECAALSCDDWRARNLCPNPPWTQPNWDGGMDGSTLGNGWSENAWTENGYGPLNALADSTLTGGTLDEQRFNGLLSTAADQLFIKYIVQCALPPGTFVHASYNGMALDFEGALGLAPEWNTGPCGTSCQEWVTACMFARNNYYGIPVGLSIRGQAALLTLNPGEAEIAPVEEGAFFGNMFADPWYGFSCRGHGDDPISTVVRRCTFADPGAGSMGAPPSCWFFQQGLPCDQVCDGRSDSGAFLSCHAPVGDGGAPMSFSRVVTVYLKKSELGQIPDAGCNQ